MDRVRAALALVVVVATVTACGDQSPSSPASSASPSLPGSSPVAPSASPSVDPSVPTASVVWAPLAAGGDLPGARFGHSWTVDPSDAAAYLFAGRGSAGPLADLWRYDMGADAWELRASGGPSPDPRSGHAAVWVDEVGVVVLGGQATDRTTLDDGWAYDPRVDAWSELPTTADGPAARSTACAAIGPDGRIWLTHGFGAGGAALDDTWALDPIDWSWTRIEPVGDVPAPRGGHGCWWTTDGRLVLHGGRSDDGVLGDTWALDGAATATGAPAWSSVETSGSIPRNDFGSTLASDLIVIVAGQASDGQALDDVMALAPGSLAAESFVAPDGAPDPRTGTAIVDDPGNERSLLFGGAVDGLPTDELWSFDLR